MINNIERSIIIKTIFDEICNNSPAKTELQYEYYKNFTMKIEDAIYKYSNDDPGLYQRYCYTICSYWSTIYGSLFENNTEDQNKWATLLDFCTNLNPKEYQSFDTIKFIDIKNHIKERIETSKVAVAVVKYKTCPGCGERNAKRTMGQTKAGDEGGTSVFTCLKCSVTFK